MRDDAVPAASFSGFAGEAAWAYAAVLANAVTSLSSAALLVRAVGATEFGFYAVVLAVVAVAVSVEAVLNVGTVRAIQIGGVEGRDFVASTKRVQPAAAVAAMLLGVAAAVAVYVTTAPRGAVLVVCAAAAVAVTFLTATSNASLVADRRYRVVAVSMIAGGIVQLMVILLLRNAIGIAAGGIALFGGTVLTRVVQQQAAAERPLERGTSSRSSTARVARFAWPVAVLGLSPHLVTLVDVVAVSSLTGVATAGLYRLGSVLPTQAISAFFRGYDVVYPRLTRPENLAPGAMIVGLNRVAAPLAAAGLGAVAAARDLVSLVMLGSTSHVTATAVAGFCIVAAMNVPAHGLSLFAISRGTHQRLAHVVAVETLTNIALTIVLVSTMGFAGAILATIIAVGVSNLVIVPIVVARQMPEFGVVRYMVEGLTLGAAGWILGYVAGAAARDTLIWLTA